MRAVQCFFWKGCARDIRLIFKPCVAPQAATEAQRYQRSDFASAFISQLNEYDYWITEIEGQVPSNLRGTLFRNGPGRSEVCPCSCTLLQLCVQFFLSFDAAHAKQVTHKCKSKQHVNSCRCTFSPQQPACAFKPVLLLCRFERGKHKYAHVLDGDGYVCSFSFDEQGRVHFRSAYVKTRYTSVASNHMTVPAACSCGTVI